MNGCRLAGVTAAFYLSGAVATAAPPSPAALVAQVLRGPTVPYEGTQHTTLATETGPVEAVVTVRGNGRGATLREFATAAGVRSALLEVGTAVRRRTGTGWIRLPDRITEGRNATAAILANYQVTVGSPTVIAGRRALPIHMVHRSPADPSRSVWLDPETGIILKDRLVAPDGRERSLSLFTRLKPAPQPASLFRLPVSAPSTGSFGPGSFEPRPSALVVEAETGRPVRYPAYVPTGYRIALHGLMHTGSGRLMPAVRYSNGVAAFTIFQRGSGPGRTNGRRGWRFGAPQGRGPEPSGQCLGHSDLQSSVVEVSGRNWPYLLVGDLAEAELMKVAKSLP